MTMWQGLVRGRAHAGIMSKEKTKAKTSKAFQYHPSWYRPMLQQMIDGKHVIKRRDFIKTRINGEGQISQVPAFAFKHEDYD